jgi:hypothetical protein
MSTALPLGNHDVRFVERPAEGIERYYLKTPTGWHWECGTCGDSSEDAFATRDGADLDHHHSVVAGENDE